MKVVPTINGFVVIDGNTHTIAIGSASSYSVIHHEEHKIHTSVEKPVTKENGKKKAKKQERGNAEKRQQMAVENREIFLKLALDQTQSTFMDGKKNLKVKMIYLAGPGNMKLQLLKMMPQNMAQIVETRVTSRSGKGGLYELATTLVAEEEKRQNEEKQRMQAEKVKEVKAL